MIDSRVPFLASPALNTSPNVEAGLQQLQLLANRSRLGETLSEKEIKEVGKKFEALLLHQLLATMRKTVPQDPLFGESSENRIYRDMFDEELAQVVAESGQTGIGDSIAEEILRQQQVQQPPKGDSPFRPLRKQDSPFRFLERNPDWKPLERDSAVFRPVDRGQPHFRPLKDSGYKKGIGG